MRSVAILITALIVSDKFSRAHSEIKCYTCSTKDATACLHPEKNRMEPKVCKPESLKEMKEMVGSVDPEMQALFEVHIPPDVHFNCMKQATRASDKEYVIRGCQPAIADEKLDICNVLSKKNFTKSNVLHCSLCNRDGCNGGRNFHCFNAFNLIASFVVLATSFAM